MMYDMTLSKFFLPKSIFGWNSTGLFNQNGKILDTTFLDEGYSKLLISVLKKIAA